MDEAAALRAQVRRLQARLAENGPERPLPAPRELALQLGRPGLRRTMVRSWPPALMTASNIGSSGALLLEESWDCLARTSPPLRAVYDVAPL
jgi:hypothetical protein